MPDMFVTEFSAPESACHPHDLLARLYREIGISAVAAALDVLGGPKSSTAPAIDLYHRLPAMLRGEDLAPDADHGESRRRERTAGPRSLWALRMAPT